MSHFAVLIIGKDPEEQLGAYHEFESTGCDDEYVQDIDITEEQRKAYLTETINQEGVEVLYSTVHTFAQYLEEYESIPLISIDSEDFLKIEEYSIYALLLNGEVTKVINRTNPNAKWDWYVLGGRWSGFLKLKDGRYADSARFRDIDIDGMGDEAASQAKETYENLARLLGVDAISTLKYTWEALLSDPRYASLDIDERRTLYHNQKLLKTIQERLKDSSLTKEDRSFLTWLKIDKFQISKEEYINNARKEAFMTFAVIKDGKWYERGAMGWFGCVSDEKDPNLWREQFMDLLKDAKPDDLISIYDCHI